VGKKFSIWYLCISGTVCRRQTLTKKFISTKKKLLSIVPLYRGRSVEGEQSLKKKIILTKKKVLSIVPLYRGRSVEGKYFTFSNVVDTQGKYLTFSCNVCRGHTLVMCVVDTHYSLYFTLRYTINIL
jgi:hypothetical protein